MCQCPALYARNVKLVSQKNRRQRTMHVSCKQMCPTKGSQQRLRSNQERQKEKKNETFHKDDKVSATTVFDSKPRSNLTTLLDLCVHDTSILKFHVRLKRVRINRTLEISHSEISLPEQVPSQMWLTPTKELSIPLTGSLLRSRQKNTAVTFTECSRFRNLVLTLQSISEYLVFPQKTS